MRHTIHCCQYVLQVIPLNRPHTEVRKVTEEERHRELHELDRMIILSQDQDL